MNLMPMKWSLAIAVSALSLGAPTHAATGSYGQATVPPVSLAAASPEPVLRSFLAAIVGRWGVDCSRLVSSFRMEDGLLLGETYFNGQLGTRSTIRLASVNYAGMANGLHRFEYLMDSRGVVQGESLSHRVIMETDLGTVRRSVYSEQLGSRNVLIRDGILLASNTAMPMQGRCH